MPDEHDREFVDFVRDASPRLLRTAWFICGDPVQAEELVQAALEKVYLRWGRVRHGDALAYTRKCLLNAHIDERRRISRERPSDALPERGTVDAHPEDTIHVVALLGELPLRERQVVVLRYYVGLPESEVADLLGVRLGTVKSSASRGLAKLRGSLDREESPHVR
jgi:RNA polymerase sigma-70 factor (sigma-E family)